ncbi:glycosyl hydrolase [Parabacteroides pacaensis]|uniref:glycosyl hydrolase n=1 Tax=Parabacteroides pacaensis TaxID=2086575 RepID=UPI000D0F767E|nr:glycosyl hydrolase [Parabacteroides pacaensis]
MRYFNLLAGILTLWGCVYPAFSQERKVFVTPPDSCRPGVYWYFMDGNLDENQMTKDLESMKEANMGSVIFLEVNVGVPRGKVDFFSEEWQSLFTHAVKECERLGIEMTLGIGPGWNGSGGPWVEVEESMRHLVYSKTDIAGKGDEQTIHLAKPQPHASFFGLPPEWEAKRQAYYEDVVVLAYPADQNRLTDINAKSLVYRAPFSSAQGVVPLIPLKRNPIPVQGIKAGEVIDLTSRMQSDSLLVWNVPKGDWTILRMGMAGNGAITRPAPLPGLGFECDKFSKKHLLSHFDKFANKLLDRIGPPDPSVQGGLKMLHIDSWEVGAQNWTDDFMEEFTRRRGYSPLKYLPVYSGQVVENSEISERFLFDIRLTAQEMVVDNHVKVVKQLAHKNNLRLSIEPYDMSPFANMEVGRLADVPMCEFWNKGLGFNTLFSCHEAASVAHLLGKPVVASESFTSNWGCDAFTAYPTALKNQTDWAFATGINKLFFHTFTHQALKDDLVPGMTMGGYGVHWDRGQTWWPMVADYHRYLTRCSYMLQQGNTVADVLYLAVEAAPFVFLPPASATEGGEWLPDRREYNFDGCPVSLFMELADVKDGKIVFPSGASYHTLVLPASETMTPQLLEKLKTLLAKGATIIGNPPSFSPSLSGFPECDRQVEKLAGEIWGKTLPYRVDTLSYGKGKLIAGQNLYQPRNDRDYYPSYEITAGVLEKAGVLPDFVSDQKIRYTHRRKGDTDIYFIANKVDSATVANCTFRATGIPQIWNPVTGECLIAGEYKKRDAQTQITIPLDAYQSYFVIFDPALEKNQAFPDISGTRELPKQNYAVDTSWSVKFDTQRGGPEKVMFPVLIDWSTSEDDRIKYYSGIASYENEINVPSRWLKEGTQVKLKLGEVRNMAQVYVNGEEVRTLWTAPWEADIKKYLKKGTNHLEIKVANLWANRLIGDEYKPQDGITNNQWPTWLEKDTVRTSGRYTFTTHTYYTKDSPLQESGLLGPVWISIY